MQALRRRHLLWTVPVSIMAMGFGGAWAETPKTEVLEEIVVTSMKRTENLMEVPATVHVFNAQLIERAGIARPADFVQMTPSMSLVESNHAGETLIQIRGNAQSRNSDAPVAILLDGVLLTSPSEFNQELFDIQQIEVMKGPQGALYGRNAIAGAIVITTKAPSDEFELSGKVGYGNGQTTKANVSVGGPIIKDKLFIRASGAITDREGFFTNITTKEKVDPAHDKVGRLRLDFKATDNLTLDLRVGGSRFSGGAINWHAQQAVPIFAGVPVVFDANNTDGVPFFANVHGGDLQTKGNASLKADYKLGYGAITSVTAWSQVRDVYWADKYPYAASMDQTQYNERYNNDFSEELRFTSPDHNRFKYIVGAYYLHSKTDVYTVVGQDTNSYVRSRPDDRGPFLTGENPTMIPVQANTGDSGFIADHTTNNAWSLFAQASYDILDNLQLALAGRYDSEKKKNTDTAPPMFSATSGVEREATFKKFQPRVDLRYTVNESLSTYASYAEGFKSGGFNLPGTFAATGGTVSDGFGEETSKNFEVGFKSRFLDNRISFNAAAYYTKLTNSQQFVFFPLASRQAITPIDKAENKGIEADFQARLATGLDFTGGISYVDSKIKELSTDPTREGNRMPYVPAIKINLGIQYAYNISDTYTLISRVDYEHLGDQYWETGNFPGTKRNALDLFNARLSLETEHWTLTGWVRNLTNKKYNTENIVLLPILQATYQAPPRTYGAELSFKF